MTKDNESDRLAGVLVGLAAGDALGAGYEFGRPPNSDASMCGGGLGGWEPGEWTDDTQMALCIAEQAATGDLDTGAVGRRFLDWFHSGPADVGNQTRDVLSRARMPEQLAALAKARLAAHPGSSAGNGSLMRTAPVALGALGNDEHLVEHAENISALTHADPLATEACALWCVAIDRAIREDRLDGIFDGLELLRAERRGYWSERLAEAEVGPPARFRPNGFVVTALQAAVSAIWHTPIPPDLACRHLRDALQCAVHIGDDTDTVAAIAGSLLGARWGASAVPVAWKAMLHGKPGLYGAPDYTSHDLVRLAVLAGWLGRSDETGWPAAEDLTSYYASRWPSSPEVVRLEEDPGVVLANVFGAAVTPADVTVSLCRVGRTQLDSVAHPLRLEIALLNHVDSGTNPNLDFVLNDLARAITAWRSEKRTVLIHGVQTEADTPAVAAAYLAQRFHLSGPNALRRVCDQLPNPRVNPALTDALERIWQAR